MYPIINPYTDTSILNYVRECNWNFYSRFCHTVEHKMEVKWQIIPQMKVINWEIVFFRYFHYFPLSFKRTALVILFSAVLLEAHVFHILQQEAMNGCLIL